MHIRDGRSRKQWTPDQQERALGGGRNKDAAALLDAALEKGMISEQDRASKLTTVQRYVGNPTMRKALGIVRDASRDYWINRDTDDFANLIEAFLEDVRQGQLSSRSDAAAVIRYSDNLLARTGVGDNRGKLLPLNEALDKVWQAKNEPGKSRANGSGLSSGGSKEQVESEAGDTEPDADEEYEGIRTRTTIGGTAELESAFAKSSSQKLQSLYKSITTLPLRHHCPLITVGFWSLAESLAALHGGDGCSFDGYFSHNRLEKDFGFANKDTRKDMINALKRLTEKGNSTKHSSIAGSFDAHQIANDFDVLTPLMIAVLQKLPT